MRQQQRGRAGANSLIVLQINRRIFVTFSLALQVRHLIPAAVTSVTTVLLFSIAFLFLLNSALALQRSDLLFVIVFIVDRRTE
jgi:hypothetical protein